MTIFQKPNPKDTERDYKVTTVVVSLLTYLIAVIFILLVSWKDVRHWFSARRQPKHDTATDQSRGELKGSGEPKSSVQPESGTEPTDNDSARAQSAPETSPKSVGGGLGEASISKDKKMERVAVIDTNGTVKKHSRWFEWARHTSSVSRREMGREPGPSLPV